MNAVEIEEAVSELASAPFDPSEFPFQFLVAFGNKATTIKKLRAGASNKSDLGGVLQTSNVHIAVSQPGEVSSTLAALKASPATTRAKAKFVLATDGDTLEAEELASGEIVACAYAEFPDHFGFFLPLAGITTVKQIRESSFDIRATSRLNRLYVELLKDNPDWAAADRRPDMNHFMARLIFCFFAEDTDIFHPSYRFTDTVAKMSERDSSNRRSERSGYPPLGGPLPLCERAVVLGQHRCAALQQDRALLSAPYRQPRLEEDQPRHFRFDDPGRRG